MTLFSWLLIGHLVGDWMLQNDWMAQGKRTGLFTAPGLIHFTVYTLTTMIVLFFADIPERGILFLLSTAGIIFVSHWLIDATYLVEGWMKFYRQTNVTIVRVMVDQTFHLLILAGVSLAWTL